jgi:hypothetical protein
MVKRRESPQQPVSGQAAAGKPTPAGRQLTSEERAFIVSTLQQLELRGNHDALRQAIQLIDSVCRKLGQENDESNT